VTRPIRRGGTALAGLLALSAGCGWHGGLEVPGKGRTIGIEVFEVPPEILERNLEPRLSEALTRAVVDLVDATVASPAEADVVVRGQILQYQRRAGVRDKENQLRETGIYVSATASLVDRRSGEALAPAARAHVWSGYVIEAETSVANEAQARDRALRNVAQSLILDLLSPTTGRTNANAGPAGGVDVPVGGPGGGEEAPHRLR
jgi:hypothetical protein